MNKNDVIKEFESLVRAFKIGATLGPEVSLNPMGFKKSLPMFEAALSFMKKEFPDGKDEYPRNLLMELGILPLEKDIERMGENLEYVLNTLDEDDRIRIIGKYKEGLSRKEIAEKYGVPCNNSQIPLAMRKLCSPLRIKYICAGKEAVIDYEEKKVEFSREVAELEKQLGKLRMVDRSSLKSIEEYNQTSIYRTNITDLNLSTRSCLALLRAGYKTVGDFKGHTSSDMLMIKDLGKKSITEILEELANYGIVIENPYK